MLVKDVIKDARNKKFDVTIASNNFEAKDIEDTYHVVWNASSFNDWECPYDLLDVEVEEISDGKKFNRSLGTVAFVKWDDEYKNFRERHRFSL